MLMFSNITGADLGLVSRITARALFCDFRSSLRGALSHQCKLIGLRAVRVNFEATKSAVPVDRMSVIRATARRAKEARLAVQLFVDTATAVEPAEELAEEGVPLILDHFAGFKCGMDINGPIFTKLLKTLETGNILVKLSAPYRTPIAMASLI